MRREVARVQAVDGVSLEVRAGRDARPRRRVGLRQVDARALPRAPARADCRAASSSRAGTSRSSTGARCGRCAARCRWSSRIPYGVAQPAQARGRADRRPARDPRPVAPRRQAARAGADGRRRPRARALQPLSARVLGRPAPAHRRGARARAQPAPDRRRRARLGARRVDPGAGRQPARRPAGRVLADVRLHRARPRRRPPRLRPHRGDVPRQDRRALAGARSCTSGRSTRTPRRCSRRCRSPTRMPQRERIVLEGDVPSPISPPSRLPLPSALPLRDRDLRDRRASAAPARRRAPGGLPPPAQRRRGARAAM